MAGRIKVRGDLVLAQKLEEVFEKAGGREVHNLWCDIPFLILFLISVIKV